MTFLITECSPSWWRGLLYPTRSQWKRYPFPFFSSAVHVSLCLLLVAVASLTFCFLHAKENSFYSSSDSEDEEEPRKFHVEIKPVQPNNGTHQNRATIDELKASIGNIVLSPASTVRLRDVQQTLTDTNLLLSCSLLCPVTLDGNRRISNLCWRRSELFLPSCRCLPCLIYLKWPRFLFAHISYYFYAGFELNSRTLKHQRLSIWCCWPAPHTSTLHPVLGDPFRPAHSPVWSVTSAVEPFIQLLAARHHSASESLSTALWK